MDLRHIPPAAAASESAAQWSSSPATRASFVTGQTYVIDGGFTSGNTVRGAAPRRRLRRFAVGTALALPARHAQPSSSPHRCFGCQPAPAQHSSAGTVEKTKEAFRARVDPLIARVRARRRSPGRAQRSMPTQHDGARARLGGGKTRRVSLAHQRARRRHRQHPRESGHAALQNPTAQRLGRSISSRQARR